jgi:predicted nucleotidyltransferase
MNPLDHAKRLASELERKLGDKIDFILLYGSAARGQADEESDIDLLIVGDKSVKNDVSKIRTQMDLEDGTLTTIVFKTKKEFEEQRLKSDFLSEVAKTSVALYGAKNFARA